MRKVLLFAQTYKGGNRGTERLRNLPKGTQDVVELEIRLGHSPPEIMFSLTFPERGKCV